MSDTKLTPAQRRVIDNLQAGRHWSAGFSWREWPKRERHVLECGGLIAPKWAPLPFGWRLTEKGKSV